MTQSKLVSTMEMLRRTVIDAVNLIISAQPCLCQLGTTLRGNSCDEGLLRIVSSCKEHTHLFCGKANARTDIGITRTSLGLFLLQRRRAHVHMRLTL